MITANDNCAYGDPEIPGILGGAGPGATAQLYLDIVNRCRLRGLPRRPAILIASLEIDLALERELLQEGVGIDGYWDALDSAARSLVAGGADFLVLPCNSLHVFLPELASQVPVPILSIVEAVAREADVLACRRVGLLATTLTVEAGLYQTGLARLGIEVVGIDSRQQDALEALIQGEVDQSSTTRDRELEQEIIARFAAQGVGAIVAGCTELKAIMAGWQTALPVIDSLDALGALVADRLLTTAAAGVPVRRSRR